MSLMNVSHCKDFGVISTDTLLYCMPLEAIEAHMNNPFNHSPDTGFKKGTGVQPSPPKNSGRATKIMALPHIRAIFAANGTYEFISAINVTLSMSQCEDLADFDELIRPELQNLFKTMGRKHGCVGVILGWSDKEQSITGLQFRHWDGFKAHKIQDVGSQPPINPKDADIERLKEHYSKSGNSIKDEAALHLSLCRNQRRTYLSGQYPDIFHCNGDVSIAFVTRDEIKFKNLCIEEECHG